MEKSRLRQRLIGALVLVALVALVVPFFLDDQADMPTAHIASIPPAPEQIPGADLPIEEGIPGAPVDEVTPDTVIDATTPATTSPVAVVEKDATPSHAAAAPSSPVSAPAPVPAPAASTRTSEKHPVLKPAPGAWVVQLGSFSSEQNAWALRDKLRNKGYHAFVERVSEGNKMVIRVRIGPELQRAKAEAVQQKLAKEMKIKGIVMSK